MNIIGPRPPTLYRFRAMGKFQGKRFEHSGTFWVEQNQWGTPADQARAKVTASRPNCEITYLNATPARKNQNR